MSERPKYPGIRVVSNGNQLVSTHTEARLADAGVRLAGALNDIFCERPEER